MPVRRTASRVPQRLLSPVGTRADNGVMSNHDDRDGEEADVAYEAVAQLTLLAGSGETQSRRESTLKAEINVGTALSELYVLGQDLCDNLIWQVRHYPSRRLPEAIA